MLMVSNVADERLTTAHRAKLAYIYVRQSSVHQVRQHQESTELQYRLVDRAVRLGWPHERVQVIDEDLGKSGAGGVERQGFQKLIAEIGLGNSGLAPTARALLGVWRAHRRRRTSLRSARLSRPSVAGLVRHHERGRTPSDTDSPPSRRASKSSTRRTPSAVAGWALS